MSEAAPEFCFFPILNTGMDRIIGALIAIALGVALLWLLVITLAYLLPLLGAFVWLRHLVTRRFVVGWKTGLGAAGLGLAVAAGILLSFNWAAAGPLQCLATLWLAVLMGGLVATLSIQGWAYYSLFWPHRRAVLRSLKTTGRLLRHKVRMHLDLRKAHGPIQTVERHMQAELREFEMAQAEIVQRVQRDGSMLLAAELTRLERTYSQAPLDRLTSDLQSSLAAAGNQTVGAVPQLRILFLRSRVHLERVNLCAGGDYQRMVAERQATEQDLADLKDQLGRLSAERTVTRATIRTIRNSRPVLA